MKSQICQLPGCRSPLTGACAKYCCSAHQRAHYAQQGKAARAAITRSRIVYCSYCHELIVAPAKNQKIHTDCVPLAADERCVQRRARLRSEIPIIEKVCVCGRKFNIKATNTKKRYCTHSECNRDRAKKRRIADHESGRILQKRKLAKIEREDEPLFQDVMCKCPGCGTKFLHRFEPAWIGTGIPRKYCPRHPACLGNGPGYNTLNLEAYSIVFEDSNHAHV